MMRQQINLYNSELGPQRTLISAPNLAFVAAGLVALVLLVGSIGDSRLSARKIEAQQAAEQLKQLQERAQQLAQQVANAKPDPALQAEHDRLKSMVESRSTVLSILEQGSSVPGKGYAEVLRGLARQSVTGLWLTDISVAANGGEMELKGRTTDRALVAEYLTRLNEEKVFAGRSFAGLHLEAPSVASASAPQVKTPPYLEFSLSGSQEKASDASILGTGTDEKTGKVADGKEKKS